jgi:maleylacetoacetate isomerase/maleylpyruvate isomerase
MSEQRESSSVTIKLYGFWRSLASYRVRAALLLKRIAFDEISIDLLHGAQHSAEYRAVNPQAVVPALVVDDGPPLIESLAIVEYLDERFPEPPLLPKDARGRARVRGLAMIVACDAHPLVVPRIRKYLEQEMHHDEAARSRWLQHWTGSALATLEAHLATERDTGRFCHGDAPTMADLCLASQVFAARYFDVDLAAYPVVQRIFHACMEIDAFDRAQPTRQPDAPAKAGH